MKESQVMRIELIGVGVVKQKRVGRTPSIRALSLRLRGGGGPYPKARRKDLATFLRDDEGKYSTSQQ